MNKPRLSPPKIHLTFGLISFLLGFAFIIGGPIRASASAYNIIADQGGPYVWGTTFVALGVALVLSVNRLSLMRMLFLAGAAAYTILAAAFLISAWKYSEANFTAVIAYGGYAALHLCAYSRSKQWDEFREYYAIGAPVDCRRVAAIRNIVADLKVNQFSVRATDGPEDIQHIFLARVASVLSVDWDG